MVRVLRLAENYAVQLNSVCLIDVLHYGVLASER